MLQNQYNLSRFNLFKQKQGGNAQVRPVMGTAIVDKRVSLPLERRKQQMVVRCPPVMKGESSVASS